MPPGNSTAFGPPVQNPTPGHPRDYRLQWQPYQRTLTRPMRIGSSIATSRSGLLLRVEDLTSGTCGFGEGAPLEDFGTPSLAAMTAFLEATFPGGHARQTWPAAIASAPAGLAFGLRNALRQAKQTGASVPSPAIPATARSAALLTLHEETAADIARWRQSGFRTFKLKVGQASATTECKWFIQLLPSMQAGERLRLDPNQRWQPHDIATWYGPLSDATPTVEFVEEPIPAADHLNCAQLAALLPVPIALDESLCERADSLQRWLKAGWPGYWIIKPTVLAAAALDILAQLPGERLVISSAFETAIGLSDLIELAKPFAADHGLGTGAHFSDALRAPQSGARVSAISSPQKSALWNRCCADF